MRRLLITALCAILPMGAPSALQAATVATFQSAPRDIGVGDPLRRPLLDALRPSIEAELAQPVQFVVTTLRVQGNWAFAVVAPQQPNGRPIDFSRTQYAEAEREGFWDGPTTYALLRRQGQTWHVTEFVMGPTDVAWSDWPERFGAPAGLMGLPDR